MTTLASTKNVVKQCIKIHSTVVDNGGKIYDMTDKDYEKYVISDAVHISWKGWVYMDEQIAKHMKGEPQPEVDKPKIKIQIAHNSTILIEGMCYFYILNFIE